MMFSFFSVWKALNNNYPVSLSVFFKFIYLFWEREREIKYVQGRGERGKERIPRRLHTVRTEPDLGLHPTNCEIMTWVKIKSQTLNQLSPQFHYLYNDYFSLILSLVKIYYTIQCISLKLYSIQVQGKAFTVLQHAKDHQSVMTSRGEVLAAGCNEVGYPTPESLEVVFWDNSK